MHSFTVNTSGSSARNGLVLYYNFLPERLRVQVVCVVGLKESGHGHEIGPLMAPSPQSSPQDTERATGFFPQALESMSQQPGAGPGQCVPTRG